MRVAGVGGTGKTYLIDAICTMLDPEETSRQAERRTISSAQRTIHFLPYTQVKVAQVA